METQCPTTTSSESSCHSIIISCCQGLPSCSRPAKNWLDNNESSGFAYCRHGSSGFYGAIREDNRHLAHFYLTSLTYNQLLECFNRESKFGDTLLIFAASLGRVGIGETMLNFLSDALSCSHDSRDLLLSDYIDYESSRGKIAIVESIRGRHAEMTNFLLLHHAALAPSRFFKMTPFDWGKVLGETELVDRMNRHLMINDVVTAIMKASSRHDFDAVSRLCEGGSPYHWGQDKQFKKDKEEKLHCVAISKQNVFHLEDEHTKVYASLQNITTEIQNRQQHIDSLKYNQQQINRDRVTQITNALAKVKVTLTPSNIEVLCYKRSLQCEEILIAKGFCTLFLIENELRTTDCGSSVAPDDVHWQNFIKIVKDETHFYRRLNHFFFSNEIVATAANVRVQGLSKTCSEYVKTNTEDSAQQPLLNCLRKWLDVIFRSATGYEKERELLLLESEERSILEKRKIDEETLISSRRILREEIVETNNSISFEENLIQTLERKLHLSKVMKFVTNNGHTVLSWAALSGNEAIVRLLLKNGAHTAIAEDTISLCAVMIQIFFRRYLLKKEFSRHPTELLCTHNSKCLALSMRISSLHRTIKRQLRSIHHPLIEALFNGHVNVVNALQKNKNPGDLTMHQVVNMATLFSSPGAAIPLSMAPISSDLIGIPYKNANLVSMVISCVHFQHNKDPKSCSFMGSLRSAIELVDTHLINQTKALESKIRARRKTILQKYRQLSIMELNKAMHQQSYIDIVKNSSRGGLSLDYENKNGVTPLILAAVRDESAQKKQQLQLNKKPVSAVVYMLDRISPYKPTIDYESSLGRTALSAACAFGRLRTTHELLERGARINQQSVVTGQSALMAACIAGKLDVVKMLIERGADVDLKDHSGVKALQLAQRGKHFDIVEFLEQLK